VRAKRTLQDQSRKQKIESRNLAAESIEALRARGVMVLTKAQTATALQVSERTVTAMIGRKEISHFRIGGKHVRIRIEEAIKQMEGRVEEARRRLEARGAMGGAWSVERGQPQRAQGAQR
jgi:excisionase family DNA binding protein